MSWPKGEWKNVGMLSGEWGCLTMDRRTESSFELVGIHNSVIGWHCVSPLCLTLLDPKTSGKDKEWWGNISSIWERNVISHFFIELGPSLLPSCSFLQFTFLSVPLTLHNMFLPKFSHSLLVPIFIFLLLYTGSSPFYLSHFLYLLPSNSFLPPLSHPLLVHRSSPSPEPSPSRSDSSLTLFLSCTSAPQLSSTLSEFNLPLSSAHLSFLFSPHLQLCRWVREGRYVREKRTRPQYAGMVMTETRLVGWDLASRTKPK